jgi:hypothetical protein
MGGDLMTTTATLGGMPRLAGRVTLASGVIAAIGVVFLVAMFVSFAIGAKAAGMAFGWINDVLVMVSYLLTAPAVLALGPLLRPRSRILYPVVAVLGLLSIGGIVVLQLLLVIGALTFAAEIGPVSVAYLGLAVWFVVGGYLGRVQGILPNGGRMGVLGATYVGYPIWAFWMGRHLLRRPAPPERGRSVVGAQELGNV